MSDLLINSWAEIILGLLLVADIIVSATPSKKDDQIVGYIKTIVLALSSNKKSNTEDPK